MTKPSSEWSNREVEGDLAGWHALRKRERKQAERERRKEREEQDYAQFEAMFLERGGEPSKAREMYSHYRNEAALKAAKAWDQQTQNAMHAQRRRAV